MDVELFPPGFRLADLVPPPVIHDRSRERFCDGQEEKQADDDAPAPEASPAAGPPVDWSIRINIDNWSWHPASFRQSPRSFGTGAFGSLQWYPLTAGDDGVSVQAESERCLRGGCRWGGERSWGGLARLADDLDSRLAAGSRYCAGLGRFAGQTGRVGNPLTAFLECEEVRDIGLGDTAWMLLWHARVDCPFQDYLVCIGAAPAYCADPSRGRFTIPFRHSKPRRSKAPDSVVNPGWKRHSTRCARLVLTGKPATSGDAVIEDLQASRSGTLGWVFTRRMRVWMIPRDARCWSRVLRQRRSPRRSWRLKMRGKKEPERDFTKRARSA